MVLLAASSTACAGNPGHELSIDLRTDLVAQVEFDEVVVTLDGSNERIERTAFGVDYVVGRRVVEYAGISGGTHLVHMTLRRAGSVVAQRDVGVSLTQDLAITVVITRDCRGVSCPNGGSVSDTACLGGMCVDPRCTPETPEFCPDEPCTADTDCPLPPQSCLARTCLFGTCFVADDGTCGSERYCSEESGCVTPVLPDGGPPTDGGPRDGGRDAGMDAGPPPCMPACEGFDLCMMGSCVPAASCLTSSDCSGGLICRNRRCVPGDVDIDGDGSPASEDCDETRADSYPGAPEFCNAADEDCDGMIDEGNAGVLCAADPMGGECMAGVCGCPPGRFDLDGVADTGCECAAMPAADVAAACASPTDLGPLTDDGQRMEVMGNALPIGRDVWYRFRAVDVADTACDNFYARVQFSSNPGDAYRFVVSEGACGTPACPGAAFTDFSRATDFRQNIGGRLTGECPCVASVGAANVSLCTNNSTTYFVRVFRRPEAPAACAPYVLEFSNGVYSTP